MPPMPDRVGKALQGVTAAILCAGCGQPFEPARKDQRHCRPSCRKRALDRRRADQGDPEQARLLGGFE